MDIGSAVSRAAGISAEKLMALPEYPDSPLFSPLEKLALELADHMAKAVPEVPDALFAALRGHLDEAQLVELATAIAWENFRARFNRVFDIESDELSEGAFCALPVRAPPALAPPAKAE
jgi:alkylhydroperoxidase family enzyme